MEKSCQIDFLRSFHAEFVGQSPAQQGLCPRRGARRLPCQRWFWGDSQTSWGDCRKTPDLGCATSPERTPLPARRKHRPAAGRAPNWREQKALRGEGFVVGNLFNHLININLIALVAQCFAKSGKNGRHGGQGAKLLDALGQDVIRNTIHAFTSSQPALRGTRLGSQASAQSTQLPRVACARDNTRKKR